MKKLTAMMLVLACFLALTGCKPAQPGSTASSTVPGGTTAVPPTTTVSPTTAVPPTTTLPSTTAPDPATFTEVWRSDLAGYEPSADREPPEINGVRIYDDVKAAMETFSDPNNIFPLWIWVTPADAPEEEIYDAIFKSYIAYDEMESDKGIYEVCLTAEQIADLKCPSGYTAIIQMAPWPEIYFWEGNIDEITTPTKRVEVWFECPAGGDRDENLAAIQNKANEIYAAHGITEDMLCEKPFAIRKFTANLSKDIIASLLEDSRITSIQDVEHEEFEYVLVDRATGSIEYFKEKIFYD